MARKHNKRANKRSQSVDIKAYAQQLEGVFRKYPARKFNYKQLAGQLGYKPQMVKAKIEMAPPGQLGIYSYLISPLRRYVENSVSR